MRAAVCCKQCGTSEITTYFIVRTPKPIRTLCAACYKQIAPKPVKRSNES